MQTIDIYRSASLFVTIKPDEESSQSKSIMGPNVIRLTFEDSRYIPFKINDYCTVFGEKYILLSSPAVTKLSQYFFRYTIELSWEGALLSRVDYFFLGDDNTLKEPDFSLMGNSNTFMDLLLQNLHRIDTAWEIGEVQPTGYKNITFNSENCYNALARIAEEFETEFIIEGKRINLAKRQKDTGYSFKHGRNLGLRELTPQPVDGTSVVTRLYAYGSEKNLPSDYRNFTRRLKMTDGLLYVEKNVDQYGVIEHIKIFDEIFPNRTGTVTGINAIDPFEFSDSSIDFNLNDYLLPGITAKVTFNTGQLSGYTLEIKSYDHTNKRLKLLLSKEEKALDIPNVNIRPAIGDKYVFVDIVLPQSYIDAAEAKLKTEAIKLLDLISEPQLKYAIVFDPTYLKKRNIYPKIGDLIWIKDEHFEVERRIRVTSTSRRIVNEDELTVEVSDTVSAGKIDIIINAQNSTAREVVDLEEYLKNNSTLNNRIVGDLSIKQGSIIATDLPTTTMTTGFSSIVIDNVTGKIYRKI